MIPPDIGVMVNNLERDRIKAFAQAAHHGFGVVHTSAIPESWLTGPERAAYIAAARGSPVRIATMFAGFDGQSYASLESIRKTVGLTIPSLRDHRCRIVRLYSDLARDLGVISLALHLGFLPDPLSPDYVVLGRAIAELADYFRANGQTLLFETGQEPAAILLSLIRDVHRPNVGVNFDAANFLLYGTDEPMSALERLAPFVRGLHCKDGLRSCRPGELGQEVPIGQGDVPFPDLIRSLLQGDIACPLIIEREHGPTVVADILAGREYLTRLLSHTA
jgi:sugar phosphate isomerase/epimerase